MTSYDKTLAAMLQEELSKANADWERLTELAWDAIQQRDEARMWAARFYQGWECNDSLLPDWIKKKEVPHGKSF